MRKIPALGHRDGGAAERHGNLPSGLIPKSASRTRGHPALIERPQDAFARYSEHPMVLSIGAGYTLDVTDSQTPMKTSAEERGCKNAHPGDLRVGGFSA